MRVDYCEQGSSEWHALRAGRVTSTTIDDVMRAKTDAKTRTDLKFEILGGILGGPSTEDSYVSKSMQEGKDREPLARTAYELAYNVMLERVGFVFHPTIERAGSSPDSLIGDDGVLELKCPKRKTHLKYMKDNRIPPEYLKQCIWHLICTERPYLHFVSFCPELPPELQLFVKRMEIDEEVRAEYEDQVRRFLDEVEELRAEITPDKVMDELETQVF